MTAEKIYGMPFAKLYPILIAKAERRGRIRAEVDRNPDKLVDELAKGGNGENSAEICLII